jgi:hypothetical protein
MRVAIGLLVATLGLTFLTYGLAASIEGGSCGGYRAACPSGTGPMILLMVLGSFIALGGAAVSGVFARFMIVFFIALVAGAVIGIVDLDDTDTRPGYEILVAVIAPMVLIALPGVGKQREHPAIRFAGMPQPKPTPQAPDANFGVPPKWQPRAQQAPTSPAAAEDIASRLRQLDQLKSSGLLGEQEYAERRKQILAEL